MMRKLIATLMLILTAAAASVTATGASAQGYRLQPGDTLSVEVLEDPSLNRNVLVLPDGSINFPFTKGMQAAGRTVTDLQASLATALAPNFASKPNVFVSLSQLAAKDPANGKVAGDVAIYFMGEVNKPGEVDVPAGTSLLQALAMSGGLTKFAATKRIQLRRTGADGHEIIYKFNYKAIANGAQITGSTKVQDGDVIIVPQRGLFE